MKKIYLLLVALLVSCLYSTQARAGEVTVEFGTTELKSGSYPGTTAMNKELVFDTNPQIKISGKVSYTSSTSLLKLTGASGAGNALTISTTDGTKMTKIVFNGYTPKNNSDYSSYLSCSSSGSLTVSSTVLEWTFEDGSDTATLKLSGGTRNFQFSGVTITYADGGGDTTPTLIVNKEEFNADGQDFAKAPYTGTIILTGRNLTGDVTATPSDPALTFDDGRNYCTPAEAEEGHKFDFTLNLTSAPAAEPTITFTSENADPVVVTISIDGAQYPTPRVECDNITALTQLGIGDEATYLGAEALVTYKYGDRIYVQDDEAAIRLTAASGVDVSSIQIGDKLTNLDINRVNIGWELASFGAANIASNGNEVVAKVVTPDQLADNLFRFVEVKYGMFETAGVPLNTNAIGLDVLGTDIEVNVLDVNAFSDFVTEKGVCTVAGIYRYENIETQTPKILSPVLPPTSLSPTAPFRN